VIIRDLRRHSSTSTTSARTDQRRTRRALIRLPSIVSVTDGEVSGSTRSFFFSLASPLVPPPFFYGASDAGRVNQPIEFEVIPSPTLGRVDECELSSTALCERSVSTEMRARRGGDFASEGEYRARVRSQLRPDRPHEGADYRI